MIGGGQGAPSEDFASEIVKHASATGARCQMPDIMRACTRSHPSALLRPPARLPKAIPIACIRHPRIISLRHGVGPRLRLAWVVVCGHGRRGCGRGACRTCARQHPRRQSGRWTFDEKRGKMAPCGLGCRLCRSSGWPHRLGTSVFATSSAERSLELDESFQAIQCRPPESQGLARYGEGGGGSLGRVAQGD